MIILTKGGAQAISEEVKMLGIEIRAGVHTGECALIDDNGDETSEMRRCCYVRAHSLSSGSS